MREVLLDRQVREYVVALRHKRDAAAHILGDRRDTGIRAVEIDRAVARAHGADDAAQQRGLAGAVMAEDAEPRAVGQRQRDVVERRQRRHSRAVRF